MYNLINKADDFQSCVDSLSQKSQFSIDLEFDKNRFRYGFNLCLMQIFDGKDCYLIDPLSDDIDIKKIFPLIEDPKIEKVAFSFSEDLRLLHSLGCYPQNVYDISFAAALLNFPPVSLTKLLHMVLEIETDKSSQQSNWFKRPLSEDQKNYAAEDVIYLLQMKNIFEIKAKEAGVHDWIKQENYHFTDSDYADVDHNGSLKEKDKGDLSEFEWHIFNKLIDFREELAEEMNKPAFHLFDKHHLTLIARNKSRINDWDEVPSVHRSLKDESFKQRLRALVHNAEREAEELNLSKEPKSAGRLSKDDYDRNRMINERFKLAKKTVFGRIQAMLDERIGKFARTFIISNRLIKEIANNDLENLLPYKKELFDALAKESELPVDKYISG